MFKHIAEELSIALLRNNIIDMEKRECYIYGLESAIPKIFLYTFILITALLTNSLLISAVFIFCYISLRQYTGGYHCKTAEMCLLLSFLIYLFVLLIYRFQWGFTNVFIMILSLFSVVVILLMSPIESSNKPLESMEKKKYRILSIVFSLLFLMVAFVFYILEFRGLQYVVSCSLVADAILMLISVERRKKHEESVSEDDC